VRHVKVNATRRQLLLTNQIISTQPDMNIYYPSNPNLCWDYL